MASYKLLPFASDDALAHSAAQKWIDSLKSVARGQPYLAALSGGRIAKKFCSAIASLAQRNPDVLSEVHFFWADERCVPPDNADSNFSVANECLFKPLNFPSGQIHRMHGEAAPKDAASNAEIRLRQLATLASNGQPVLDIIFLGMGEDGHVASLFPGESANQAASPAVYRPVTAPKPPPLRITLGYSTIAAARQVWVLASGEGKEAAFRKSILTPAQTPLGTVLEQRDATTIFSDISFS